MDFAMVKDSQAELKLIDEKISAELEPYLDGLIIRVGERQTIETLINEEASLFAKLLRRELKSWQPRICSACCNTSSLKVQIT
jgi:hypothetical protein